MVNVTKFNVCAVTVEDEYIHQKLERGAILDVIVNTNSQPQAELVNMD